MLQCDARNKLESGKNVFYCISFVLKSRRQPVKWWFLIIRSMGLSLWRAMSFFDLQAEDRGCDANASNPQSAVCSFRHLEDTYKHCNFCHLQTWLKVLKFKAAPKQNVILWWLVIEDISYKRSFKTIHVVLYQMKTFSEDLFFYWNLYHIFFWNL